jgi:hypothetical protein
MDSDRKYKQRGYMDTDRDANGLAREDRPRVPTGPKPPIDITGPRLPRLVQAVTASRCFNCSTTLPVDIDWKGNCPKCNTALHCCKQCSHFEPSTRFQCVKPIPVRIPVKDQSNTCELFKPRVTVARDAANSQPPASNGLPGKVVEPRSANDARAAFDSLFKK